MNIIITCVLALIATWVHAKNQINMNIIPQTNDLASKYAFNFFSSQLKVTSMGNSVQMFVLTSNFTIKSYQSMKGQPVILFTSLMHPREQTAIYFVQKLVNKIIKSAKEDAELDYLMNKIPLVFIPYVNIDGVRYYLNSTQRQGDEIRKNLNGANGYQCKHQYEKGVDINRNFDYNYGTIYTSKDPCKEEYRGQKAFSEPQAQSIKQIFDDFKVVMSIDIHGYGDIWIYPFASIASPEAIQINPLYPRYQKVFKVLQQNSASYDNCYHSLNYIADGVYIDWALMQGSVSFAFQFGRSFRDIGKLQEKGLSTMLDVLKVNINQIETSRTQNDLFCLKSMANVEITYVISQGSKNIDHQVFQPDQKKCYQLDDYDTQIAVKIYQSKISESNFKFDNLQIVPQTEPPQGFFGYLILGLGIFMGIGLLCGLSIFFEKGLNIRVLDEEKKLGSSEELQQNTMVEEQINTQK